MARWHHLLSHHLLSCVQEGYETMWQNGALRQNLVQHWLHDIHKDRPSSPSYYDFVLVGACLMTSRTPGSSAQRPLLQMRAFLHCIYTLRVLCIFICKFFFFSIYPPYMRRLDLRLTRLRASRVSHPLTPSRLFPGATDARGARYLVGREENHQLQRHQLPRCALGWLVSVIPCPTR